MISPIDLASALISDLGPALICLALVVLVIVVIIKLSDRGDYDDK